MKAFLGKLIGIREGEWTRSLLMFLYAFFLLSAYLILKPVRNSLFLENFDARDLVFMYMIIGVFAALIITTYTKIGSRLALNRFMTVTTLFIIANLIGFWWLITQEVDWLVYVFYIWVSLFGAITTSQFWLLANHLFDAREAKRLFPFIGAGAIAGGLAGSAITTMFAKTIGTESLLLVCVVFMSGCLVLLTVIWPLKNDAPSAATRRRKTTRTAGTWPLISRSRYLRLLTGAIALTVIVSTFIDFQFNWVVQQNFPDKDIRTAFFGDFFFWLSLISLVMQLSLSSRILRRFGVGAAIMILPAGLLLGSAAVFLWPRLIWSAILVKISDGSFRHSINKAGMELLYLPIPSTIKDRIKGFMDIVGDRFARGIGGVLLFVVSNLLTWSIGDISILSGVLIGAWLVLAVRLRKEYSIAFREALQKRTIDLDQVRMEMRDAGAIEVLSQAIEDPDPSRALFALGLTSDFSDERLKEPLLDLQLHSDPRVRSEALRQLRQFSEPEMAVRIYPFIIDEDQRVRLEAIRFICQNVHPDDERGVRTLLASADLSLRAIIFRCELERMAMTGKPTKIEITRAGISALLTARSPDAVFARRELSHAIGYVASNHPLAEEFSRLLDDEDLEVRRNTVQSAGRTRRQDLLPLILERLIQPKLRSEVTSALISYGPAILSFLRDRLFDEQSHWKIRIRIPKVIARIGGRDAVNILQSGLKITDVALRFTVLKALGTLRRRDPVIPFSETVIRRAIEDEARRYYVHCAQLVALRESPDAGRSERFLIRTLKDRRSLRFEQIFRLSGLIYNQRDTIRAFENVWSGSPTRRARAIEFLDTVWTRRDKELIFPALESSTDELAAAMKLFDTSAVTRDQALRQILSGDDFWLAATAVQMIKDKRLLEYQHSMIALSKSPYRPLCETAGAALTALSTTGDKQ